MQNAIELCHAIKPIVIASKSNGERFEQLTLLTQAFSGMFVDFEADLTHFGYVYTQFAKSDENQLKQKLANIKADLEKSKNIDFGFKLFVNDMLEKSKRSLVILDPLSDTPHQVLATIMDNSYIVEPKKHFRICLNEKARKKIENQMNKHFASIEKGIARKDYDLAMFKFNELIQLKSLIDQDEIKEKFSQMVQDLMKNMSREKNTCVANLNRALERSELVGDALQTEYVLCLKKSKECEHITRQLGARSQTMFEALNENLVQQSNLIAENIKSRNVFVQVEKVTLVHLLFKLFIVPTFKYSLGFLPLVIF